MGKNAIEVEGVITEALPNGTFHVQIETKEGTHTVLAYLAGKMRADNIRVLIGDTVRIEMSPYDLNRGRIVYRHRDSSSQQKAA